MTERPEEPLVLPADPGLPVPYTVVDTATEGTRKGEPTLPSAVLDLLAAIRDQTDVPLPSTDPADERAYQRLMSKRLGDLHSSLKVVLSAKWIDTIDPAEEAAYIRKRTTGAPVTYELWERTPDGGDQS